MQDKRSWAHFALEKVVWEGRQAAGKFLESLACEQAPGGMMERELEWEVDAFVKLLAAGHFWADSFGKPILGKSFSH